MKRLFESAGILAYAAGFALAVAFAVAMLTHPEWVAFLFSPWERR